MSGIAENRYRKTCNGKVTSYDSPESPVSECALRVIRRGISNVTNQRYSYVRSMSGQIIPRINKRGGHKRYCMKKYARKSYQMHQHFKCITQNYSATFIYCIWLVSILWHCITILYKENQCSVKIVKSWAFAPRSRNAQHFTMEIILNVNNVSVLISFDSNE